MKNNKRIKVFLGGYVNSINAQNLNCAAIARYIDKTKFEPGVLTIYSGSLPTKDIDAKIFKVRYPHKLWRFWSYLRGILWCDVAYLPKGEIYKYCKFLTKILRKKSFITVEGVISGTNLEKMLAFCKTEDTIRDYYHFTTKTYAITKHMAKVNGESLEIKCDGVVYLGIDINLFKGKINNGTGLKNIAFIGNNMKYKGIEDIFSLAETFPDITFHIIGGGIGYDPTSEVNKRKLGNVICHGLKSHTEISELLKNIDLHVFPSRSEGFPKVTLETAASGVPSIVYGDYGASEWISSGSNGYVVDNLAEIVDIISDLKAHPEKLTPLSANAINMAKSFDWNNVIKDWENVIEQLAEKE